MQATPPSISPQSQGEVDEKRGAASYQVEHHTAEESTVADQYLGRGRPSRSQFNLTQTVDHKAVSTIFHHVLTPVKILFFPVVF